MKERILELRKSLGLSQEQFASKLSLSRNFLSLVEKGDRGISDRTVSDICRIFNVNETWLRTGEGQMINPLTREAEIAQLVLSLADGPEDTIVLKMARLLPKLTTEQIEAIYNLAVLLENNNLPD